MRGVPLITNRKVKNQWDALLESSEEVIVDIENWYGVIPVEILISD